MNIIEPSKVMSIVEKYTVKQHTKARDSTVITRHVQATQSCLECIAIVTAAQELCEAYTKCVQRINR